MICINLPDIQDLEYVQLDNPKRPIIVNGMERKGTTTLPMPGILKNISVVYILIDQNNKPFYVGQTSNFKQRMSTHNFRKESKGVYYLEENDNSKRLMYEMVYKCHFFDCANHYSMFTVSSKSKLESFGGVQID